jgi:hypothetical protein
MKHVEKESGPRGQKVHTGFGRDDSSHKVKDARGGKMGGGVSNLAHSLSGASAVQNTAGKPNKTD